MRNRLLALLLAVSVVLAGGAGWWFGAGPGGLVAVPELTGRSLADAESALASYNFEVSVSEEYSSSVPADFVSRSEPAFGAAIPRGSDVTLFVSLGPELVSLSGLKGLGLAAATEQLRAAGFELGTVTEVFDAAAAPGAVIAHDGEGGEQLPLGSAINLVVSLGAVPNVVGLSESAAREALTNAGLAIDRVTQNFSDTVPEGYVIRLVPLVEPLAKAGSVRLVVSKGPEQVAMPSVIGETIAAAKLALENLGLKVVVNTNQLQSAWGIAKVTAASAVAGQLLKVGDTVIISSN